MLRNPYNVQNVVKDEASFIGRTQVVNEILDSLQIHQSVILYGQRRIGKSSILSRLEKELRKNLSQFHPVSMDMQEQPEYELGNLLTTMARSIKRDCGFEDDDVDLGNKPEQYFVQNWLPSTLKNLGNDHGLILLMDEFDSIYFDNENPTPDAFYNYLHKLLANPNVKLVVVLGRDPDELPESAKSLLRGSQGIHIPLMTESEVNDIIDLSKKVLRWSSESRKEIWSLTKGHPLIVQSLCYKLFDQHTYQIEQNQKPEIKRESVDNAFDFGEFGHIIQHAWDRMNPEEKVVICYLSNMDHGMPDQEVLTFIDIRGLSEFYRENPLYLILDKLKAHEWIERDNGVSWIKIPIYQQWVEKKHDLKVLIARLFDLQQKADKLLSEAKETRDLPTSIQKLEDSLKLDNENQETQSLLIEKLGEMIQICIRNARNNMAMDYIPRLAIYYPQLAENYRNQINTNIRTNVIMQRIELYSQDEDFANAQKQLNVLEKYDPIKSGILRKEVLLEQVIAVAKSWGLNMMTGLPIVIAIAALGESSEFIPANTATQSFYFFTSLFVLTTLAVAYLESIKEKLLGIISLAFTVLVGIGLLWAEIRWIPDVDLIKVVAFALLLSADLYLLAFARTNGLTKGFGAVIILTLLLLFFITGGLTIPTVDDEVMRDATEKFKNPPDPSGVVWKAINYFVDLIVK